MKTSILTNSKLKIFLRIILSSVVICYLIFAPMIIMQNNRNLNDYVLLNTKKNYTGIIELWNIDTFESGSVSKNIWLEKRAIEFESKNPGTYIVVNNLTISQALLNFQNDNYPDMICFGNGFGQHLTQKLLPLDCSFEVNKSMLKSGVLNGKQMAIPIMSGAYCLTVNESLCVNTDLNNFYLEQIEHSGKLKTLGASDCESVNPLGFLTTQNQKLSLSKFYKTGKLDTYSQYVNFISENKFCVLLGTQRDVYRIVNKQKNGAMQSVKYYANSNYNDLIHYISVVNNDNQNMSICTFFVNYLLSDYSQQSLQKIHMFSVNDKLNLYNSSPFEQMEDNNKTITCVPNAFLENTVIDNYKKLCEEALNGSDTSKKQFEKQF